ncbi:MAG: 3-hydroxyacyl-CoA dehydrogenase family protein [Proteobacteria bacterium]|nr:3-hydroxyacyl-CoA dehydrogenase family protein [Pseudomonadota bacterium]MBU4383920.1 3-hydroxyacyl-CoA dehydrogenase family protein [Pseudomonadota bacterium]MCG2763557.1 3-hydroxyacyl-CoA dehydrogenase family protein [Desulfarculaceae bacterium]
MESSKKVGVIGAGMMGAEIALCFAAAGNEVKLLDCESGKALEAKQRLTKVLERSVAKGRFDHEKKDATLDRISVGSDMNALAEASVVVEAVFEDLTVKQEVWRLADSICSDGCLFASNTSSIPITLLAAGVEPHRRERFLGAHFFSPAWVMKLVEVIPGLETADEAAEEMMALCLYIGKSPIEVRDVPGFAVNRILHAMWIEVNRLVEEGVASPEAIDIACCQGLGHPVGPHALMDLTSNDLNLRVQQILFNAYGERFRPRPGLKQKVDAGHLGRKSGRGWFRY